MSRGQMLRGQMSPWQLESFLNVQRNLPLKFHQNWVSNSWDISDMGKCRQDKCFLNKCHPNSWNLLKMVQGAYFLTAEIFLIYGQLSPGQMLLGQMSPCQLESVQNVHRNLPSTFHQNRVSTSWDIGANLLKRVRLSNSGKLGSICLWFMFV